MRAIFLSEQVKKEIDLYSSSKDYQTLSFVYKLINEIDKTNDQTNLGSPRKVLVKELNGWISRRISWKSRLVYKIDEQNIWIASCRGHYEVLFPIIFN